jgi:hypothetical protein
MPAGLSPRLLHTLSVEEQEAPDVMTSVINWIDMDLHLSHERLVKAATAATGLRTGVSALALAASGLVMAADVPAVADPAPQVQSEQELDEVLVEGRRVREKGRSWDDYQQPFSFLARLVGQFVIDGSVDLHGEDRSGDQRNVTGQAHCIGFGSAPGVLCELNVRWHENHGIVGEEVPGEVSTLDPAVMLFGFEPAVPGISYVLLDNKGVADTAVGEMTSPDTMRSRSKCVGIPGNCQRTVRITAEPDLSTVRMNIDLALDQQKSVSFAFVMQRVPDSNSVVYGRKQPREEKK